MNNIVIVGAGAAGMLAAVSAAQNGAHVILLDKNEKIGKKLFITGKGRCNVTNSCDRDLFFSNIVSNGKFLYGAFSQFNNRDICELIENGGCRLKEERGGRIFPESDHSSDIIKALKKLLDKNNVEIRLHATVKKILIREWENEKRAYGVELLNGEKIIADNVIVATGGLSYSGTGSTGDGYRFAQELGHTVISPKPGLVPLKTKEGWVKKLQGLSLKNVAVSLKCDAKVIYSDVGEMLFTHFGVSGPLILSASSYYSGKYDNQKVDLLLDLKPGLSLEQLDKRVLKDFESNHNKDFKNALDKLLPQKIIPVVVELSGIYGNKKVNEITQEERKRLVSLLKELKMTITGTEDINLAIITKGGIHVKEINPKTMESKLVKNLFFAGEIIDVDALTGGFNLQVAWSTGYVAGVSAVKRVEIIR